MLRERSLAILPPRSSANLYARFFDLLTDALSILSAFSFSLCIEFEQRYLYVGLARGFRGLHYVFPHKFSIYMGIEFVMHLSWKKNLSTFYDPCQEFICPVI